MSQHPSLVLAQQQLDENKIAQASALLWEMHERQNHLNKDWLDCALSLIHKLDVTGFRPQSQYWLAIAGQVAPQIGLNVTPPLQLAPHLQATVFDAVLNRNLKRYPAFEGSDAYIYVIEIAGACNLRCPSCPVGNMPEEPHPKGLMDIQTFEQILLKISQDRPDVPIIVHLFNWGEPLLHPQLDQFIKAIRLRGWQSIVSTTLNISRGLEKLVAAAPDILKVSASGWSQDEYEQTHVRGDIEQVKENLKELRKLIDVRDAVQKSPHSMNVMIGYHLYKHNLAGAAKFRKLAEDLQFNYTENNAVIQPIERNLDLVAGRADPVTKKIAEKLLVHPLEISKFHKQMRSGHFDCELRFNMTAINADRSVALCCGTYSKSLQIHNDFLSADVEALEQTKYKNEFCAECMQCGFAYTVNDVL